MKTYSQKSSEINREWWIVNPDSGHRRKRRAGGNLRQPKKDGRP